MDKQRRQQKSLKTQTNNSPVTALYVRVSTDSQFEEGYSVEAQQKKLKQWCVLRDITNYEFYIDGGWSGSNINRPEMKRLIADIINGKVKEVIVFKLDRLSRSQKDTIFLLEDVFEPNKVSFVSISENFDTNTPYGKAMVGILSVFAQLERENIRERTRMGMYERVKSGLWMGGGMKPFGYDYDPKLNTLVPNEHAEDVKKIYDLYLQGYSTTQLANMFPVSGDRQIMMILSRETYLGKINYKGEIIEGRHQAIIDDETWKRVQAEKEKRTDRKVTKSQHLLTGLVYCGKCGAKYRYQKWGNKTVLYCYSQQKSKPNLIKDPNCDNMRLNSEPLEQLVVNDLFNMSDAYLAIADKKLLKAKNISEKGYGIQVLEQKCSVIEQKIKRLYNLYAEDNNELLLETIKENQHELEKLYNILESEKATTSVTNRIEETEYLIKNLRSRWDGLSMDEKHRVLRATIKKIIVTDGKVTIDYII